MGLTCWRPVSCSSIMISKAAASQRWIGYCSVKFNASSTFTSTLEYFAGDEIRVSTRRPDAETDLDGGAGTGATKDQANKNYITGLGLFPLMSTHSAKIVRYVRYLISCDTEIKYVDEWAQLHAYNCPIPSCTRVNWRSSVPNGLQYYAVPHLLLPTVSPKKMYAAI